MQSQGAPVLDDLAEGDGDLAGRLGERSRCARLRRSRRWRTQSVGSKRGNLAGTERDLPSCQLLLPAHTAAPVSSKISECSLLILTHGGSSSCCQQPQC